MVNSAVHLKNIIFSAAGVPLKIRVLKPHQLPTMRVPVRDRPVTSRYEG
jgi:hypothetical protein